MIVAQRGTSRSTETTLMPVAVLLDQEVPLRNWSVSQNCDWWRSALKINIPVPPDDSLMCAPNFTKKLADLQIKDGEPLTLTCSIQGDPDPQVTWHKNGEVKKKYILIIDN
jgi:hypothetical protein